MLKKRFAVDHCEKSRGLMTPLKLLRPRYYSHLLWEYTRKVHSHPFFPRRSGTPSRGTRTGCDRENLGVRAAVLVPLHARQVTGLGTSGWVVGWGVKAVSVLYRGRVVGHGVYYLTNMSLVRRYDPPPVGLGSPGGQCPLYLGTT